MSTTNETPGIIIESSTKSTFPLKTIVCLSTYPDINKIILEKFETNKSIRIRHKIAGP